MHDPKQSSFLLIPERLRLEARVFRAGSSRCDATCPELLTGGRAVVACKLFGGRLQMANGVPQRCAECVEAK